MAIGAFPFQTTQPQGIPALRQLGEVLAQRRQQQERLRQEQRSQPMQQAKLASELAKGRLYGGQYQAQQQKMAQAQADAQRMEEFRKLLSQAVTAPGGIPRGNVEAPLRGTSFQTPPEQGSIAETAQRGFPQMPTHEERTIVDEGSPAMRGIDALYSQHPEFQDLFNKSGFKTSKNVKLDPGTGQVFMETSFPSGRKEVKATSAGRSPESIDFAKKLAEGDAKIYGNAVDQLSNLSNQADNLDYISDLLSRNPQAGGVVGPVNAWVTRIAGKPEDKALLGHLATTSGNIALDAAKSIKGAFTGRDQALINSIKPNIKDQYPEFVGKLKAMRLLNNLVTKRLSLISRYLRSGKSSPDAIALAKKETDLNKIRPQLDKLSEGGEAKSELVKSLQPPTFNTRDEFLDYYAKLSPEEREIFKQKNRGVQ